MFSKLLAVVTGAIKGVLENPSPMLHIGFSFFGSFVLRHETFWIFVMLEKNHVYLKRECRAIGTSGLGFTVALGQGRFGLMDLQFKAADAVGTEDFVLFCKVID